MKTLATFTNTATAGLSTSWDFNNIWKIDTSETINSGYPYFTGTKFPFSAESVVTLHNLDNDTDVTVDLTSSDTGEATVSPATLIFTEDNWDAPRTITVTGKDDNDRDRHQDYEILSHIHI